MHVTIRIRTSEGGSAPDSVVDEVCNHLAEQTGQEFFSIQANLPNVICNWPRRQAPDFEIDMPSTAMRFPTLNFEVLRFNPKTGYELSAYFGTQSFDAQSIDVFELGEYLRNFEIRSNDSSI